MNPQDVRLHDVDTSKGHWGIFVQSLVEAQNRETIFVTMIVEQNVDEEHIQSRKLTLAASTSQLASPQGRSEILDKIRDWIETTEGDGSLDAISGFR